MLVYEYEDEEGKEREKFRHVMQRQQRRATWWWFMISPLDIQFGPLAHSPMSRAYLKRLSIPCGLIFGVFVSKIVTTNCGAQWFGKVTCCQCRSSSAGDTKRQDKHELWSGSFMDRTVRHLVPFETETEDGIKVRCIENIFCMCNSSVTDWAMNEGQIGK